MSKSAGGASRHSAMRQNLVAIGGIADIGRFSAGNDLQRLMLWTAPTLRHRSRRASRSGHRRTRSPTANQRPTSALALSGCSGQPRCRSTTSCGCRNARRRGADGAARARDRRPLGAARRRPRLTLAFSGTRAFRNRGFHRGSNRGQAFPGHALARR
jgi:hypothetical protein